MRMILQRVSEASVRVSGDLKSEIGLGLLVLLGVCEGDGEEDIDWLVRKLLRMRIFGDDEGKMNLSLCDVDGQVLVVSQFTLCASTRKGARPSFIKAAQPELANRLYEKFREQVSLKMGKACQGGEFGADMQVTLVNDGPVTIMVDSRLRE